MLRRIGEAIILVVILVAVGIVTRLGTTQPPITQTRSGHAKLFNPFDSSPIARTARSYGKITPRKNVKLYDTGFKRWPSSLGVCIK